METYYLVPEREFKRISEKPVDFDATASKLMRKPFSNPAKQSEAYQKALSNYLTENKLDSKPVYTRTLPLVNTPPFEEVTIPTVEEEVPSRENTPEIPLFIRKRPILDTPEPSRAISPKNDTLLTPKTPVTLKKSKKLPPTSSQKKIKKSNKVIPQKTLMELRSAAQKQIIGSGRLTLW